jgi:hypothetical protein
VYPYHCDIIYIEKNEDENEYEKTDRPVYYLLFVKAVFAQQTIEVTTDVCVLHLDKTNGNLVGLHWKNPDEEIIKESRLGENFRILLPLPNYEANYFSVRIKKLVLKK